MAPSEALAVERLTHSDLSGGLALSDAAGWNQTADDWALFVERGHALGSRGGTSGLIATAAALPYEGGVGWISMVLVAAAFRHRGLATGLLGDCIDALRAAGRVPVLDATPAGAPVYRRMGFVAGFEFERWEGSAAVRITRPACNPVQTDADSAAIVDLDAAAGGIGRAFLLRSFLARPGTRARLTPDRSGFVIARAGRRATQVGPLVAAGDAAAIALLGTALGTCSGRVFIDVPMRCSALAQWLGQRGFVRQRPFVRMALGDAPVLAAGEPVFALAGPEFG